MKPIKWNKITKFIRGLVQALWLSDRLHEKEKNLRMKYYVAKEKKGVRSLQIIVMVDGRYVHGGLCDRLRGITGVYGYCKARQIPFHVNFVYPFRLQEYLEPNGYDWTIRPEEISYHPQEAVPVVLTVKALQSKMHRLYLNRLVAAYPDKQLHIYTNTVLEDRQFRQNFSELFKPSFRLQQAVSSQLLRVGVPYVAMVFRFQQLLGDFVEGDYPVLSPQAREQLMQTCVDKVEEIRRLRHPSAKILVTSDSVTFLETISSQKPYVAIIPGKVVHMDYTEGEETDVYMKSFVDLLMLSKAEKVYLLQTGDMYHSGFAKRAAMIESIPYEEVIF